MGMMAATGKKNVRLGFENKVVLITGASSRIGEAAARLLGGGPAKAEFVEQGASVVVTGRRQAALDEAVLGPKNSRISASALRAPPSCA